MEPSQVLWIGNSHGLPDGWPRHPAAWDIDFRTPDEGLALLSRGGYAAVVLDMPGPAGTACAWLEQVQQTAPGLPVLIRDPQASLSDAVRLTRLGARQFLTSAEESFGMIDEAVEDFRRGLARLAARVEGGDWQHLLVGESQEMR